MKKILYALCVSGIFCITGLAFAGDQGAIPKVTPAPHTTIDTGNMVSIFARFNSAAEQTLLTVPTDKHFVLTDIIGMASIEINQGSITKLKVQLGYSPDKNSGNYQNPVSINTGIVFSPGTELVVYPYPIGLSKQSLYGYVTLSGYYF